MKTTVTTRTVNGKTFYGFFSDHELTDDEKADMIRKLKVEKLLDRAKKRRECQKRWYERNKEKVKEKQKEYYQKNKSFLSTYYPEKYQRDKASQLAATKRWQAKNKEHLREYHREYNSKHNPPKTRKLTEEELTHNSKVSEMIRNARCNYKRKVKKVQKLAQTLNKEILSLSNIRTNYENLLAERTKNNKKRYEK
jgi:hypothetical protein